MSPYAFFLSNRRESLVRAFRKKTPLSVRRPMGGGAKGGTESVHRNVTFFLLMASLTKVALNIFLNPNNKLYLQRTISFIPQFTCFNFKALFV